MARSYFCQPILEKILKHKDGMKGLERVFGYLSWTAMIDANFNWFNTKYRTFLSTYNIVHVHVGQSLHSRASLEIFPICGLETIMYARHEFLEPLYV